MSSFILLDGRAKIKENVDDAAVLDTADTEEEARREGRIHLERI